MLGGGVFFFFFTYFFFDSGYMPPEYAGYGHFSVKTDVFSFGVLVLEIMSGKKNKEFHNSSQFCNLLGHVSINIDISSLLFHWY